MAGRAWSIITLGDERQYAGNPGYDDDPRRVYRYDSDVANHRNLQTGDLVFIRGDRRLIGVARISRIHEQAGTKIYRRCPQCRTTGIKRRTTRLPEWRCNHGHEFDAPVQEEGDVRKYEAWYDDSFIDCPDALDVAALKSAALRPSDQLSIEEIDLQRVESALRQAAPAAAELMARTVQLQGLDDRDAAPRTTEAPRDPFAMLTTDRRETILAQIRRRRGQRAFRDALIASHGSVCMVSGCGLMSIVEAAHIWPYRGAEDNDPRNGLLLRADLHTLFDLDLMAVEPEQLFVRFHPAVMSQGYAELQNARLRVGRRVKPALEPLRFRWEAFLAKLPKE
jgi:putative restriction endonuclease